MRWQLRAVSSESKALLDLALASVATDGRDQGPDGFLYTSSQAFKEDWIEKRAEYHDTHQAAYAEGFTAFHSRIAAEKAGVWTVLMKYDKVSCSQQEGGLRERTRRTSWCKVSMPVCPKLPPAQSPTPIQGQLQRV